MATEKLSEECLGRMAARRGLRIAKSRARDPRASDYGRYMLRDVNTRVIVAGATSVGRAVWTLEDVEAYLTRNSLRPAN
jgi:hypothetical protein